MKNGMLLAFVECSIGKEEAMHHDYPENVIVTVRLKSQNLEADVRLPTDSTFSSWLPELIWVLNQYRKTSLDPYTVTVSCNGRELQSDDTLAALGVWDGSVLWLKEK